MPTATTLNIPATSPSASYSLPFAARFSTWGSIWLRPLSIVKYAPEFSRSSVM